MRGKPGKYLLLDLGKVVVDVTYEEFARRMRERTGFDSARLQAMFAAGELINKYETGVLSTPEFFDEVCRRIGSPLDFDEFTAAWNSMIGRPLLANELLAGLSRNSQMWAISNTNDLHYRHLVQQYDFIGHFQGCILSYQTGVAKPDERMFRLALDRMGASASEVLFADDQEVNVSAARAMGIQAFRFLNPCQFASELTLNGFLP